MTCDLNRSEEQRQILDAAAAMLNQHYPVSRLRGREPDELGALASFGSFSLSLPEEAGGAGLTQVEEALLHVAFGRHLLSNRALATAIAVKLALAACRMDLLSQLTETSLTACIALREGETLLLPDPGSADLAVLFDNRRMALVELHGGSGEMLDGLGHGLGVSRRHASTIRILAETDDEAMLAGAELLISAQLLGIAEATRDMAVAYAQIRHQFGRPIAAFQAIKHHCADMAIAAEAASSQLDFAAIAVAKSWDDAPFQVAALRRLAALAALNNARLCIQVHGGIGFSAEADAHHYLKHAHLLSRLGALPEFLDLSAPMAPNQPVTESY